VVDCPRRESDADEKEKQGEEEELPVQMSPETNGFTGEKIVLDISHPPPSGKDRSLAHCRRVWRKEQPPVGERFEHTVLVISDF
jgi:hypothetical protein